MSVGEFIEWMGDLTLAETAYRVAVAEDLGMSLEEFGQRITSPELHDWLLLYDVEAEEQAVEAENARRRK